MTTGMNLWDANVWSFVITMTLLFVAMIIANTLRNTIPALRRLMIPSSVLGGFLLLIVNTFCKNVLDIQLYQTGMLEILTYHGLGLGFSAMALRTVDKKQDNRSKTGAFDSGVTVVSTYLLQAVLGLIVTVILFYAINSFFASGILLPMGYGQGPDRHTPGVTPTRHPGDSPTAPASVLPFPLWASCPRLSAVLCISAICAVKDALPARWARTQTMPI